MPSVQLGNTRELRMGKKDEINTLTALINEMASSAEKGEQVILFRNRRGSHRCWNAVSVAWTPRCTTATCHSPFTKHPQRLCCHYCNRSYPLLICPSCGGRNWNHGCRYGAVEEEVRHFFPPQLDGMDADTTRVNRLIKRSSVPLRRESRDTVAPNVTKGLISIIEGVASFGRMPSSTTHFRSHERGFSHDAGGRSIGRKNERGDRDHPDLDPQTVVLQAC